MLEAGARGPARPAWMVDRYLPAGLRAGASPREDDPRESPSPRRPPPELRQRIAPSCSAAPKGGLRAGPASWRPGESAAAWITTIHGLLPPRAPPPHPVAAGVDPPLPRCSTPPRADRAARGGLSTTTRSRRSSRNGDGRSRGRPSAGLRDRRPCARHGRTAAHEELRSPRQSALPHAGPDPARARRAGGNPRGRGGGRGGGSPSLSEKRQAEAAGRAGGRRSSPSRGRGDSRSTRFAPLRSAQLGQGHGRLLRGGRRGPSPASAEGRRGGGRVTGHAAALLELFADRLESGQGAGAAAIDFEDLQLLAAGLLEQDRDRPLIPLPAFAHLNGRRVPGHQPPAAAADRVPARARRRAWSWSATCCKSIYGLPPRRPRRLPRAAGRPIDAGPRPARRSSSAATFRLPPGG